MDFLTRLREGGLRRWASLLVAVVLAGVFTGCSGGPESEAPSLISGEGNERSETLFESLGKRSGDSLRPVRDLETILADGTLRLLIHRSTESFLARDGSPFGIERELIEQFAEQFGLELELIPVDAFDQLIPKLEAGAGDVIAANLSVTPSRAQRVLFTESIGSVNELMVARKGLKWDGDLGDLFARYPVAVRKGTSFEETLLAMQAHYPMLRLDYVEGSLTQTALYDRLKDGRIDLMLTDSNIFDIAKTYRPEITPVLRVASRRDIAWAVAPGAVQLQGALNTFVQEVRWNLDRGERETDDLGRIRERGRIRMITRNNSTSYFLHRGELRGFEYAMGKAFAEELGVLLEIVVAPSNAAMFSLLEQGRGDFIGSFISRTPEREAQGWRFSPPYLEAREMIVGGPGARAPGNLKDLRGLEVTVRPTSSYYRTLRRLVASGSGVELNIGLANEATETEELLQQVASGMIEATMADDYLYRHARLWNEDLVPILRFKNVREICWVVREGNPELAAASSRFWDQMRGSAPYRAAMDRYFGSAETVRSNRESQKLLVEAGQVSPFDPVVREVAAIHGIDWRLVVAQIFQESRFDSSAESRAGAQGLMQIMPLTAKELGLRDPFDPVENIAAGIRYLSWTRDEVSRWAREGETIWFALAAYNAGLGHVLNARRLARDLGKDPDRWFGNTEEAMLLLAEPRYYRRARHGYVRGTEPVDYVRKIRAHFDLIAELIPLDVGT